MVVCIRYLLNGDLSSVRVYSSVHFFLKVPEKQCHVYLVGLYDNFKEGWGGEETTIAPPPHLPCTLYISFAYKNI